MNDRTCKICGDKFTPKNSRQTTCHHEKVKKCPVCGKEIRYVCNNSNIPVTCSKSCASKYVKPGTVKKCRKCGREFTPKTPRQIYCGEPVKANCVICGKEFTYPCGSVHIPTTCGSEECKLKATSIRYEKKDVVRECPLCHKKFHPVNNTQRYCKDKHYFTCVVCGKKFYEPLEEIKKNNGVPRKTCSKECLSELHSRQNFERDNEECVRKSKETCFKHYGVYSPSQNPAILQKMAQSYRNRTGYSHPSHNPESRSRQAKHRRTSKLELRICTLLDSYNIPYIHRYMLSSNSISHEFDFYIPDYKILLDADGVYFHSYLSDPDGKFVGDDYDAIRISLIPNDHIFIVAVEGFEDECIKEIHDIIKEIDDNVFDYETDMFRWCREVGFPYPQYTNERMNKDWTTLQRYKSDTYKPNAKLGYSIIKNFHKSLYDVKVGKISVKQAWENDDLLKKVIENRLIYKNNVDPSKILQGFAISKVCPMASIFNPILTRYIIQKYADEFDEIFDPFSGFSGRLLGTASMGKSYKGQDLNKEAVHESNNIIHFLNLEKCAITNKDILKSHGTYQCLLTYPPYNKKEIYANETVFNSCDEWIDECLKRFNCRRYIFVVDNTEKYTGNIRETINKKSHFNTTSEYIVVIDR